MNFEDLKDPRLQQRLKDAKTPEDILALAKECGVELSDAQLEGVAGGVHWCTDRACTDNSICLPLG